MSCKQTFHPKAMIRILPLQRLSVLRLIHFWVASWIACIVFFQPSIEELNAQDKPAAKVAKAELLRLDRATAVHSYKEINGQSLKLFENREVQSESDASRPAIIFFHGGGWKKGTPASMAPHCRYFAHRGFVCFTASYRLAQEDGSTSVHDCLDDAIAAVRYVYHHADRLGIDATKMVLSGGSAGGHLALVSAMRLVGDHDEAIPVAACVLFNPATVLTETPKLSETFNSQMKGRRTSLFDDRPDAICPRSLVKPEQPPTLLMHGTKDWLLPSARLFQTEYTGAGNHCVLKLWDGQDHGFYHFGKRQSRNFIETTTTSDQFLISLGVIGGNSDAESFVKQHVQ